MNRTVNSSMSCQRSAMPRSMGNYSCRPEPRRESNYGNRSRKLTEDGCPCEKEEKEIIPDDSREELLRFISEISFVVYEMLLYLDTHPCEQEALEYFHENNRLREKAMHLYSQNYGPLTIATADDSCSRSWEWMEQPWPWELEGGAC